MTHRHGQLLMSFIAVALPLACARGPTVEGVLRSAREAEVTRMQTVNNYTAFEVVAGSKSVRYCEKVVVDAYPQFNCTVISYGGRNIAGNSDAFAVAAIKGDASSYCNKYFRSASADSLWRFARLDGRESVGAPKAHRIALSNSMLPAPLNADTALLVLSLDADNYTILKLTFEGLLTAVGSHSSHEKAYGSLAIGFEQYRDVGGLLIPYRTTMTFGGVLFRTMEEMVGGLRAMMPQMSPERRAAVELTMEPLQTMASGQPIVIQVDSVHINRGPPPLS